MARAGLTLVDLTVSGRGNETVTIALSTGLNVVVGASDTGKTHVFELINFLLGSNKIPESLPEGRGFDRAVLTVKDADGATFRLRRGLAGGELELDTDGALKTLRSRHADGDEDTLSGYLLSRTGLAGRYVRTDAHGAKGSMSFRDVCKLLLVSEERIIQRHSPILTGEVVNATRERSVFAFFLTGTDDSQVVQTEKPKERKARLETQRAMIEALLLERQGQLERLSGEPESLEPQISQLDADIATATAAVVSSQQEVEQHSIKRRALFAAQQKEGSRLRFLDEQLTRLNLLVDFYDSDKARLTAVMEASALLHELPEGECPVCGQRLPDDGENKVHGQLEAASTQEIRKIDALSRDLKTAIGEFEDEREQLRASLEARQRELARWNEEMQRLIAPRMHVATQEIQRLVSLRASLAESFAVWRSVKDLRNHLARIENELKQKRVKTVLANRTTTSAATRLCEIMRDTLASWRYPNLGGVAFDSEKLDFVIGGQDRQSKGKGYRALTYAAFTISLMRYCRDQSIPHPGFVVLDTPLNPFKGPTTAEDSVRVMDEMKQAFYESLVMDRSGDQIVVMENEEPPRSITDRISHTHFSKNPSVGRYGFYPLGSVLQQAGNG